MLRHKFCDILRYFIVFAFLMPLGIYSQQDTLFWFAAPEVSASASDNPIFLRFLTYNDPANITVSQPANGGFTPISISIPANNVDSINLTPFLADVESPAANTVSNNGLKIVSDAEITAFYELDATANKEIFSLKGEKSLGTNFYTPFQNQWDNGVTTPASFSSIDIVATENGTTVLITPRTDVVGHVANVSYSVTLNEGETYSARDVDLTAATSLSGSIVASDKPIAVTVFSGALSNSGCISSMGDQITSETFTGEDFIVHKGNAFGDRVYILATQNGTSIDITNSTTTSTLINWGETYEYVLSDTLNYIQTSKPVYVWHASGYGCNLSGAQVPNLYCAGRYSTSFTRTASDSIGLLLYTRAGFEGMFTLNGNGSLIQASDFDVVPGTGGAFVATIKYFNLTDVPVNSYNEVVNSGDVFGMAVLSGEGGQGSGYAYLSEFNSYPFVDAGSDATICGNTTLNLNGVVGGGSVTGYWSGTGFGTFQNGATSLTNVYEPSPLDTLVSPIELILTSTGPCPVQRDTITVTVSPAPIVNASADQSVCANNAIVTLDGAVTGGASTGLWTTLGSGSFVPNATTLNADYVPSAADTTAGTVTLVLTATGVGSCNVETDTMIITISGAPTVDAGADTISVCSNNPNVSLAGFVAGSTSTGKWITSGNGLFFPDNLSLNTTYQPSPLDVNAGFMTIYLESTNNGNCTVVQDSVVIEFTASPSVDAGVNLIACTNDAQVDLAGIVSGPTTTGVWSGGAGTYSPNDQDLSASYSPTAAEVSSGSVYLTLTSTNNANCNAESDVVQIDFVAPPFANFNFTEECLNVASSFTDFSLDGYGTINTWNWDFGDANTSTSQNDTHLYATDGTYNVQLVVIDDVGCSDTAVQAVEVYEIPVAHFSYDAICSGSQVIINFTDSSYTNNDIINYWFYDFDGQGTSGLEDPSQLFTGSGNFDITHIVGTNNGCTDTTVIEINIPDRPEAGFYYNTSNGLNIGAEFSFIDTSLNSVSYSWTFGDGNVSTLQDPENIYFENGTYIVTQVVTGVLGCMDSTSVAITINTVTTEINTLIPNAISPNGDGKNDVWKLEFLDLLYPDATVEVYNRWGQQLFYSDGYEFPWDATYQGEPVSDGTYYYVINLNDAENSPPYKGTLLVLRKGN